MVQQEFRFAHKGHTEGNLLTTYLSKVPGVEFAGYSVDPDAGALIVCIDAQDPKAALEEAKHQACTVLAQLHGALAAQLYV
jgi:DNA-directed RNA polymerase subunit L